MSMNQGVEMLLARMDSHPEEFAFRFDYTDGGRWESLVNSVMTRIEQMDPNSNRPVPQLRALSFLSDREVRMLYDKLIALQGDAFTRFVMGKLLEEPEEKTEPWAKAPPSGLPKNQLGR